MRRIKLHFSFLFFFTLLVISPQTALSDGAGGPPDLQTNDISRDGVVSTADQAALDAIINQQTDIENDGEISTADQAVIETFIQRTNENAAELNTLASEEYARNPSVFNQIKCSGIWQLCNAACAAIFPTRENFDLILKCGTQCAEGYQKCLFQSGE